MNNENETPEMTQAQKIQAANRSMVTCESGNEYIIRAVSPLDFYATAGLPEGREGKPLDVNDEKAVEAALKTDIQNNLKQYIEIILTRGVVSPKLVVEGEADAAANELSIYDIPNKDLEE